MIRCIILIFLIIIISTGCSLATRSDVIQNKMTRDFRSSKSPEMLAVCIEHNAEDKFWNSLQSKITAIPGQPIEILIRNYDSIYAVVHIEPVPWGSYAVFYLGGAALFTPDGSVDYLVEGCK